MIRNPYRPAPPRWSTVLIFGAALGLLLVVLGLWVTEAEGQTKQPGVGFKPPAGTSMCSEDSDSRNRRCFPLDPGAHPFGPDGASPILLDRVAKGRRYMGGQEYPGSRQAIGFEADTFEQNGGALEAWFAEQPESHKALWTGIPTTEEKTDLAHMESRRSSAFYDRYWWGTVRVVVNERNYIVFAPLLESHGVTEPGLYSIPNSLGKLVVYEVVWTPGRTEPPPPPPPPPPTMKLIPGGINLPGCAEARRDKCRAQAQGGYRAKWCAECPCPPGIDVDQESGVAPFCLPVEEPEEPPSCEECAAINYVDSRCGRCPCPPGLVDPIGHVHSKPGHFCTPSSPIRSEASISAEYVPGVESTGRLRIVCDGCEPQRRTWTVRVCNGGLWRDAGVVSGLPGEAVRVTSSRADCGVEITLEEP